ncbi:MAG: DUF3501 family protein [Betaproteobacteria bacterium]|nr:DUF3501 family protein [Betaproteobacteria bacterium]
MNRIDSASLMTLEAYAKARPKFRAEVLAHKKTRTVAVGPNVTLIFEDELTIRYQIQEMLRIEKTFEEAGIQDELDAYVPLLPDGTNWKATMLIEFPDAEERKRQLALLRGIEHDVWVQVDGGARVAAIADEDMERSNDEKTSAVHFLRFELTAEMRAALKSGAKVAIGIDHSAYRAQASVNDATRAALVQDLAA